MDEAELGRRRADRRAAGDQPEKIDQALLGVCGEAAALEADAQQNAPDYADFVRHVFETGDVDGDKVNKKLLEAAPAEVMAACDWMALSALQDASNLGPVDFAGRPTETDEKGNQALVAERRPRPRGHTVPRRGLAARAPEQVRATPST